MPINEPYTAVLELKMVEAIFIFQSLQQHLIVPEQLLPVKIPFHSYHIGKQQTCGHTQQIANNHSGQYPLDLHTVKLLDQHIHIGHSPEQKSYHICNSKITRIFQQLYCHIITAIIFSGFLQFLPMVLFHNCNFRHCSYFFLIQHSYPLMIPLSFFQYNIKSCL